MNETAATIPARIEIKVVGKSGQISLGKSGDVLKVVEI